ncbi:hypothetical protein EJ05DRAFT_131079 [Pseudovirgaria hyperparasitica]|uniref:Uncharacterized protein n=1 Tax=Pseudovirgaria hyperparasitica TaxID=470096 RepID=A0A6A6VVW3_9PEZI|nr:uncharacterized protein EJ05DRAFT_131079 [Pseudovirgaria hyperparasitica]KAF2754722.1 hypothetical protein EJ05DRAFT_131079 [Pseudovirgaria hyperparasitica]
MDPTPRLKLIYPKLGCDYKRYKPRVYPEVARKGTFPFLDLSAELRNMIYEYSLTRESIYLTGVSKPKERLRVGRDPEHHDRDDALATALLTVCRQISTEAAAVLYSNNFCFQGINMFSRFMADIGTQIRLVQDVEIAMQTACWTRNLAVPKLAHAASLRQVRISRFKFVTLAFRNIRDPVKTWIEMDGDAGIFHDADGTTRSFDCGSRSFLRSVGQWRHNEDFRRLVCGLKVWALHNSDREKDPHAALRLLKPGRHHGIQRWDPKYGAVFWASEDELPGILKAFLEEAGL